MCNMIIKYFFIRNLKVLRGIIIKNLKIGLFDIYVNCVELKWIVNILFYFVWRGNGSKKFCWNLVKDKS